MRIVLNILSSLVVLAVAAATVFLLARLLRGIRSGARLPYAPVPALSPAIPILRTWAVCLVGGAALIWSAGHLALVVYWLASGRWLNPTPGAMITAGYVAFAAALVLAGGALLLACRPFGRRLIAWGLILLWLVAFFGLIIALLLPKYEDAPKRVRNLANVVAYVMGGHLVLDALLGMLAQKVGRPADFREFQESDA